MRFFLNVIALLGLLVPGASLAAERSAGADAGGIAGGGAGERQPALPRGVWGGSAERERSAEPHDEGFTEPHVRPTLIWVATQLVPSPEVAAGENGTYFGLRWQVTPLLWSWGVNRRLSPWRVLIAEPLVRYSGSVELFLSPELIFAGGDFGDKWLLRPGMRAYFPLIQHGDNLAASIGTSFQSFQGKSSAAFEAGAYVLYGTFGVQLTYTPAPHQPLATIATLRFRYF